LRSGLGQAPYTCVPLSPSSITWYQSKRGCLATGTDKSMVHVWVADKTVWSPFFTHGPCLTSRCCPAWQPVVVERVDLTVIKTAYYYYYYYYHKHKAAGGNIEAKQRKWLQRHFIRWS